MRIRIGARRTGNWERNTFGTGVHIPHHDSGNSASAQDRVAAVYPCNRHRTLFVDLLLKTLERFPAVEVIDVESLENIRHCDVLAIWGYAGGPAA